jgi:glucose/arabinose dehydrogenase
VSRPATRTPLLVTVLAAAVLAAALLVAAQIEGGSASAQEGELSGELATDGGFSLAVWGGGPADALLDAATARGCGVRSVWATRPGGGLVGFFPTSIALVNQDFNATFGGALPAATPVIVVCGAGGTAAGAQPVSLTTVFGGRFFERPIELLPYASGRWLVGDQGGEVLLLGAQGEDLGTLLDLAVSRASEEEGLLSLALDPDFPARPYLYAYYSAVSGARRTVLSRFEVAGDAALPASELVLLEIEQPFGNHNGGAVRFGPDGLLYLGVGDGGSDDDFQGHGQNRGTLLGTVLRLDVANADATYTIPASNPFVGVAGAREEVWAYGLRNPWRMAFDPQTGELWLGDVGEGRVEEVDVVRAGGNHGWSVLEGRDCFNPSSGCSAAGTVLPVATYRHDLGCSVTGGVVYRGTAIDHLAGHYVYGDFCSGRIWALPAGGGAPVEIARAGLIASFATGPDGAIYVLAFGDPIQRIDR